MTNIVASIVMALATNQSGGFIEEYLIAFEWNGRGYALPFHNETVHGALTKRAGGTPALPVGSARRAVTPLPPLPAGMKFTPASVPAGGTMTFTNHWDLNYLHCDTNKPGCVLFDWTEVSEVQRAGNDLVIEFADVSNAVEWTQAAWFAAGPMDRVSGFTWFLPADQRPPKRFYRARSSKAQEAPAAAGVMAAGMGHNPELKGIPKAWSRAR